LTITNHHSQHICSSRLLPDLLDNNDLLSWSGENKLPGRPVRAEKRFLTSRGGGVAVTMYYVRTAAVSPGPRTTPLDLAFPNSPPSGSEKVFRRCSPVTDPNRESSERPNAAPWSQILTRPH
jgi:hypothetical protein